MGPWCAAARVAAVVCVLALCARPVPAADESPPKAPGEPPAGAAPEPPGRVITYANDALTVRLANVAVDEVLDELGRQAGAEIRGGVLNPRIVSTEFDAVPLPEALHRLLGDQNFALVYGDGDRLRTITLLGGPQREPRSPAAVAGAPPPPGVPARPNDSVSTLLGLVASHPPVQVGGKLAQVLGSSTVTLAQVLEMSIENQDPTVRSEAVRAGLQVLETDAQLRSTVMTVLSGIDDAELATYIHRAGGPHAEETMLQLMNQSRGSDIRIKASGVLQHLRTQTTGG